MNDDVFKSVFEALKMLLLQHESALIVVKDEPDHYYLDTAHVMKNKKPLFFGAVKIGKNYVSYHLMPVYVDPTLLSKTSAALRKRMQGKSCFNFTKIDNQLFNELKELTNAGFDSYKTQGYI